MDDYESWLESELEAARAKARETERALDLFRLWKRSNPGASVVATTPRQRDAKAYLWRPPHNPAARKRASKNDAIFAAFEAAGPEGLNQEDVQRVARECGLTANPNALRALCWLAKKEGRLISLAPGRYAIAPKNGATVENLMTGETVAPAREPHDRHREGDAGGGT